jgi:hypothetical protein
MDCAPQRRSGDDRRSDFKLRGLFAFLPLLLGACGSVLSVIDDPPPKPEMAQIVFYRIGNSTILPGNANIEVNGARIASLGPRERQVGDIKPGHTVVSVASSLLPIGHYTVEFEAAAGQKFIFSVALRGDMIVQALPGNYKIAETPGAAFQIGQGH